MCVESKQSKKEKEKLMENYWEKKVFLYTTYQTMVYLFLFSSFCNARCARVLVPIRLVLSADFPSFLRSQITKIVPTSILTLVLITFLSTPFNGFGLENSIVFGDFLFCPKLALFFWGYEKTSSSYHVQSLRRTGAKTSRFRLGSPADRAWKPGAWRAGVALNLGSTQASAVCE